MTDVELLDYIIEHLQDLRIRLEGPAEPPSVVKWHPSLDRCLVKRALRRMYKGRIGEMLLASGLESIQDEVRELEDDVE